MRQPSRYRGALPRAAIRILILIVAPHRLVRAPKIVEVHPGTDAGPRLAGVGISFQMHLFVLDRAPQPFDENVVHEAAASVHRNRDAGRHKLAGESLGGESGALDALLFVKLRFGWR